MYDSEITIDAGENANIVLCKRADNAIVVRVNRYSHVKIERYLTSTQQISFAEFEFARGFEHCIAAIKCLCEDWCPVLRQDEHLETRIHHAVKWLYI